MKNKLLILQGCPCAGKSTWANDYVQNIDPNAKIVSRDEIRMYVNGGEYTMENEKIVSKIEIEEITQCINEKHDVIIDATNLNPKTIKKWEDLSKELDCDIEYVKLYIPFEEAMQRSKARRDAGGLFIPRKVMLRFYRDYFPDKLKDELTDKRTIRENNYSLPQCVICDLDATLALHQGREPFNWDLIPTDKIDPRLRDLLNSFMHHDVTVFFVTGRNESARPATLEWLNNPENKLDKNWKLFTRSNSDFTGGDVFKKMIYEKHIKDRYNVFCVFEDSNKCVAMWREQGLLTCQVANNDY